MTINYTVGNSWSSGFIGSIAVPGGSQGLTGWTVEFDAAFDITSIWNAEIVSHVGTRGTGLRLRAGMAFTIEPMVNLGTERVRVLDDGWTVVTLDGSLSAQFEHTLIVTREGYELTTLLPEAHRAGDGSSA